ncbi:MAG: hypothetical protein ACE5EM_11320 [Sphingomonadales bacterium]
MWLALQSGTAVAAGEAKDDAAGMLPHYVAVAPIQLPVIRSDGRVLRHVYIFVSVEVAEPAHARKLKQVAPRLHHAFLHELYGKPIGYPGDPLRVDIDAMKARLLLAAKRASGDVPIESILISRVQPVPG